MPTTSAPLLSVIIPAYNMGQYVGQCVSAALSFDEPAMELIVVNDGSTDNTAAVLATFDDARLKVVTQRNRGVSAARNTGLAHARGDFILPLDADDTPVVESWRVLMDAMASHPNAVVTFGASRIFSGNGHPFLRTAKAQPRHRIDREILPQLLTENFMSIGASLIRAEALRKAGPWNERLALGEDWDMWCRLACLGCFIYCPVLALGYRQHPRSARASSKRRDSKNPYLAAVDLIFDHPLVRRQPNLDLDVLRQKAVARQNYQWGSGLIQSRALLPGALALRSAIADDPTLLARLGSFPLRWARRTMDLASTGARLSRLRPRLGWRKVSSRLMPLGAIIGEDLLKVLV